MGRITWVCATCGEHFTRKYSANRHNNNLHSGNGLIVTLLDYIVGRASHNTYRAIIEPTKTINPLFMIILPDGHQNRFRKVLPVITGHTQPPTATAVITTICMETQIPPIVIRHQIL